MTFHLSAEDIRVDTGAVLVGRLRNMAGELVDTQIDLDQFLGNDNGHFFWGGSDFSNSAENIHFAIEGDGQVPVLRASLRDCEGNMHERDVNLAERVENIDGQFVFQ